MKNLKPQWIDGSLCYELPVTLAADTTIVLRRLSERRGDPANERPAARSPFSTSSRTRLPKARRSSSPNPNLHAGGAGGKESMPAKFA
jgi:hypothetical protein